MKAEDLKVSGFYWRLTGDMPAVVVEIIVASEERLELFTGVAGGSPLTPSVDLFPIEFVGPLEAPSYPPEHFRAALDHWRATGTLPK